MLRLRPPKDSDWPAILAIANRSVTDVPNVGDQTAWLTNRRSFASRGEQWHFVAEGGGCLLGYGAMERDERAQPGWHRLFVVCEPDQLDTVGTAILQRLEQLLDESAAAGSWFVEYADGHRLTRFLAARGYIESRRFVLPTGQRAIVMTRAREPAV